MKAFLLVFLFSAAFWASASWALYHYAFGLGEASNQETIEALEKKISRLDSVQRIRNEAQVAASFPSISETGHDTIAIRPYIRTYLPAHVFRVGRESRMGPDFNGIHLTKDSTN